MTKAKVCALGGCEEEFRPWNSLQKYCSRTCSNKAPNRNKRNGPLRSGENVTCEACGEEFYAPPYEVGRGRKFCSQECMGLGIRKKRLCSVCEGTFFTNGRRGRPRVTCSDECEREAKSRAKTGPGNPNWSGQKIREANWRSAFTGLCAQCGTTGVHLHHVVYAQKLRECGGDSYDPRNGMTLCWDCHIAHHNASKRIPLSALSEENWDFAREVLGDAADYYIERRYGGGLS